MAEVDKRFITVVSGLPRSGTSMMMRMLETGGMPILADGLRGADHDNPLGYYEFERVKRLDKDASWLPDAYGKAIKIIYVFLSSLPRDYRYKVLFMRRDIDEVVASQKLMLRRRQEADRMTDEQLMESFTRQLQDLDLWLRRQKHFAVLYQDYKAVVAEPLRAAREIDSFLGLNLDTGAMARSVDPALYRNRSSSVADQ